MPRIEAPTVAEHHARQHRALLDVTRTLLAETGNVPSMGAVARRAGLARTSVYQYFGSADDLLAAVVADVFPDWGRRVLGRVEAATNPAARVWAYVEANVELFTSPEQSVARALRRLVAPEVLRGPMEDFHAGLQVPLIGALTDLGEPEPEAIAALIDTLVVAAARTSGDENGDEEGRRAELVLERLRRLLGPYLADEGRAQPRR
jgi:AcrR family transcriptional regulator